MMCWHSASWSRGKEPRSGLQGRRQRVRKGGGRVELEAYGVGFAMT